MESRTDGAKPDPYLAKAMPQSPDAILPLGPPMPAPVTVSNETTSAARDDVAPERPPLAEDFEPDEASTGEAAMPAPNANDPAAEAATDPATSPVLSAIFMGVAAFAIFTVLIRMFRRGAARRARDGGDPTERLEQIREQAQARGVRTGPPSDPVTAETVDTVTQLIAQLDARAVRLETLVDRAEAAIDRLSAADLAAPPASPARTATARTTTATEPPAPEPAFGPESDPMHRRVYELADAGRGPIDIARELGQPTGQVELILALRKRA
ncbi:MAG: hypothetical protein AAF138_06060 [Planctomycetota bacterium]